MMDLKVAGCVPKFDRWSGHLLGGVQFPLRDSQSYYTQLDTNIGWYLQLWLQVEVCRQYKFTLLNPMVYSPSSHKPIGQMGLKWFVSVKG